MRLTDLLRAPNLVTLVRLLFLPVLLLVLIAPDTDRRIVGAVIFVLAGLTDVIDGRLARRLNQESDLGKLLDPLADKLFMLAVVGTLAWLSRLHWWVVAVLAAKELLLVAGAAFFLVRRDVVVPANNFGKAATLSLYVGVTLAIMELPFARTIVAIGVFLSLVAGLSYARRATKRGQ